MLQGTIHSLCPGMTDFSGCHSVETGEDSRKVTTRNVLPVNLPQVITTGDLPILMMKTVFNHLFIIHASILHNKNNMKKQ